MRRVRQHLSAAVWPGRACPPTEQRAPCPRQPCMRVVSRPAIGCHIRTIGDQEAEGVCGWGVSIRRARCELAGEPADRGERTLHPWRCAAELPGRIVSPPPLYQEEEACVVDCQCDEPSSRAPGPWGAWGPCRAGARSRTRQLLAAPRPGCATESRFVTIEWENCTGHHDDTGFPQISDDLQHRPWLGNERFHNGYIEGSSSLLALVWTATIILCVYGAYTIYRGVLRCLRSRRMKTITKV